MTNSTRCIAVAAVAAISLLASAPVWALGFRDPDQDARATGQGEAFVAQADDASAVYYNPAGLTQLHGTEVTSGAFVSFPNSRMTGPGFGGNAENNTMAMLPQFYAASDFGLTNSPWRFAFGFNVPFGNQAELGDNGPFRYITTEASLRVFNMEPTVAYQVNDQLSLGLGLNIYYSDTDLKRNVFTGGPDGHFHFNGDGDAVGATAGLMWKITPQHTIGLVYRSPFTVRYEGNGLINVGFTQAAPASTEIQFPQSAAGGYAFRPTEKLKLEVDAEWTNWRVLHDLVLHAPGTLFDGSTIPFEWRDSMFYEFGAQYELDDHWTVRAGYIFSTDTVPSSTFSPTVPDSDRHVFSVGLGYTKTRMSIDVVYQYSLSQDRNVRFLQDPANPGTSATEAGTWKSDAHAVMITSSLKF